MIKLDEKKLFAGSTTATDLANNLFVTEMLTRDVCGS